MIMSSKMNNAKELPPIIDSGRETPTTISGCNNGKNKQTKPDKKQNEKIFKTKMSRYSPAPKLTIKTSFPQSKKHSSCHSDSSTRDNTSPQPKIRPNRSFNLPNGRGLDSYFNDGGSRDFINQSPNSRDSPIPRFNKLFNRRIKNDNYFGDITSRDFINQSPMSQAATVFNYSFRQHQNRKSLELFKSQKDAKNASEELKTRGESPEVVYKRKDNAFMNTPRSVDTQRPKLLRNNSNASLNITSPRKILKHSQSDSKIVPIEQYQQTTPRSKKTNTSMRRNYSDQKLSDDSQIVVNNKNTSSNVLLSIENTEILTDNNNVKKVTGNINGLRRFSSTIEFIPDVTDGGGDECEDEESDSESDKEEYILDWLIGVESEEAEAPPEQVTEYTDEPPARETAVHIVHVDV